MTWLQASTAGARVLFVGVVAYLAVTQFLDSAAAITVRDLWGQYLGDLPFGPVADYLVVHAGLVLSLGLLASPVVSAIFSRGSRSIVWLVIVAYVLLAPAALATSWIDWFQFLGDDAARTFSTGPSAASTMVAVVAAALALYLLWQTDRLQGDIARLRSLGMGATDTIGYAGGHVAATLGIAAGALLLGGVAFGIARGVMAFAGALDPRSWVSVGAVALGLVAVVGTVAVLATARERSSDVP